MDKKTKSILFFVFFVSGLCGLLYQVIWIRLAFANFGIITPILSVTISVFMFGLAFGSWMGGKYIDRIVQKSGFSPIIFYACTEVFIGLGAFIVPKLFKFNQLLLLGAGESNSFVYMLLSALLITFSILPWCIAMGLTFPFILSYVKMIDSTENNSFSFLYSANVIGAALGTLLTAVIWIEFLGFNHTLWIGGFLNFSIALLAFLLSIEKRGNKLFVTATTHKAVTDQISSGPMQNISKIILFVTGFATLGMEVAWTRAFTPILGTLVYSFSFLLTGYLLATWIGSLLYRRDLENNTVRPKAFLIALLAIFSFIPVVAIDPQILNHFDENFKVYSYLFTVLIAISPLCIVLGYFTPFLIDDYSNGDPDKAGKSYAYNIVGCILGPLVVSYLFLPYLGAKTTLIILSFPYIAFFWMYIRLQSVSMRLVAGTISSLLLITSVVYSTSYELPWLKDRIIKRDYTATVTCGLRDNTKKLLVNGIGITGITPITKFMAHLPIAFLKNKPESGLTICFGMGTTYRSMMSWGINTTVVELVPSVVDVFGYFHNNADSLMKDPKSKIVIDDGRRFLMRTNEKYDVIVLDPPPPIESSGSSLLYSKEFYALAKLRLKPDGILQQWFPYSPGVNARHLGTLRAVTRSLVESFPYVRAYVSVEGWGVHFICSLSPIVPPKPAEMVCKMPLNAREDIMEWESRIEITNYLSLVLNNEIPLNMLLSQDQSEIITDDRPYNEYFLLRD